MPLNHFTGDKSPAQFDLKIEGCGDPCCQNHRDDSASPIRGFVGVSVTVMCEMAQLISCQMFSFRLSI